jgi:hypothetical protein
MLAPSFLNSLVYTDSALASQAYIALALMGSHIENIV